MRTLDHCFPMGQPKDGAKPVRRDREYLAGTRPRWSPPEPGTSRKLASGNGRSQAQRAFYFELRDILLREKGRIPSTGIGWFTTGHITSGRLSRKQESLSPRKSGLVWDFCKQAWGLVSVTCVSYLSNSCFLEPAAWEDFGPGIWQALQRTTARASNPKARHSLLEGVYLYGTCDSDFAGDCHGAKSTSGWIFFMAGGAEVIENRIKLEDIPTHENAADDLTKPLDKTQFGRFIELTKMVDVD
ncbi:hypothetical protein B0H63DRAFT_513466 [Podospora didyma]|uniref:Uncharacterized protein n=1 Tax=Podospora didyma TaxID=330526 RepID=A0AAE0K9L4_9PEZI|nr:hypothetical protein B0H63DRAFT_513466 [Podospora didyma]